MGQEVATKEGHERLGVIFRKYLALYQKYLAGS